MSCQSVGPFVHRSATLDNILVRCTCCCLRQVHSVLLKYRVKSVVSVLVDQGQSFGRRGTLRGPFRGTETK